MRCPDCNKFVSYDDSNEPEADDADIDAEGHVTGTVRVYLTCAECGTDLKEANFDLLNIDYTEAVKAHREDAKDKRPPADDSCADSPTGKHVFSPDQEYAQKHHLAEGPVCCEHCGAEPPDDESDDDEHELEIEVEAEMTSRTEGKGRGLKTFYGYHATAHVKCSCGHEFDDQENEEDMQASQMDELT